MNFKLLLLLAVATTPLAMSSCAPLGVPYASGYDGNDYNDGGHVSSLPYGYQTVYVSSVPYFYHNDFWYRRNNGRYYRTSRPSGYNGSLGRRSRGSNSHGHLSRLPSGYRSHNIGGVRYYNNGNSWYTYRQGRYYPSSRPHNFRSSGSGSSISANRNSRGNSRSFNRNTTSNRRITSGSSSRGNPRSFNRNTTTNRGVAPGNITRKPSPATRATATNRAAAQRTSAQRAATQRANAQTAARQRATNGTATRTKPSSGSTQQRATQGRGRNFRSNR